MSDRPTPPTEVWVDLLGTTFSVPFGDLEAARRFAGAFRRCLVSSPTERPRVTWPAVVFEPDRESALAHVLAGELTAAAIGALEGEDVVLHAAGVADDQGRVLSLIGPPGAGKTTAAIALCQGGFGYVTDEAVAVDAEGRVRTFPRPLAIAEDGQESPKVQVSPDELGLRPISSDLTLAGIVVLDRQPIERGAASLEPCGAIDALLHLIPQASSLPAFERPLRELTTMIERSVGVHVLHYAEIGDTAPLLAELLHSGATTSPSTLQPASQDGDPASGLMDGRVRRAPFVDAVLSDDEALLLIGDVPVRISGIGLTIWDALDEPLGLDELTSVVTEVHGAHPDALRLVGEAVAALTDAEVLGFAAPEPIEHFRTARRRQHVHAVDHDGCCGPGAMLSS